MLEGTLKPLEAYLNSQLPTPNPKKADLQVRLWELERNWPDP
jgi:hypothetical protein